MSPRRPPSLFVGLPTPLPPQRLGVRLSLPVTRGGWGRRVVVPRGGGSSFWRRQRGAARPLSATATMASSSPTSPPPPPSRKGSPPSVAAAASSCSSGAAPGNTPPSPPPSPSSSPPLWDEGWTTSAAHWPSPAPPGLPGAAPAAGVRPPISDALLRAIVDADTPDYWVNDILWALLGYRRLPKDHRDREGEKQGGGGGEGGGDDDGSSDEWDTSAVAEAMVAAGYGAAPPDFIGRPGATTAAADRPVKKAIQALNRSVPAPGKQLLKSRLGFRGYKVGEMTPNRTRRATAVNWMLWWLAQHGLDTEADDGGSWAKRR